AFNQLPESDRYTSTTYLNDYKVQPDIAGSIETSRLKTNLKCESGVVEKESTYLRDFIPWSEEDMELCRSKSAKPGGEEGDGAALEFPVDVTKLKPQSKMLKSSTTN
ncbi:uncharacterized protein NPIL_2671, partial [Nephila pilipes]